MSQIHHSSIIEDGAIIGRGTTVSESCFIGKSVVIGEDNTIESHCVIVGNTTIGRCNSIASHSVLGTAPQDVKPIHDTASLNIGDENKIGQYVLINTGTNRGGGVTNIGDRNSLMSRSHIGHDVQMGSECKMDTDSALGGHVVVDDYADFGKSSAVHQFVEVGMYAKLGALSALTQDLPPFGIARGNRAKIVGINRDKRLTAECRESVSQAYSVLFENRESPYESASSALGKHNSKEIEKLYRFIIGSSRGIPFKRKLDVN